MGKAKKFKLFLSLFYFLLVGVFLYYFLSKFSFQEITSYDFIKNNREYFFELRQRNSLFLALVFILFTIIWVLAAGFGSPVAILSGFIFGKWIGTLIVALGLSIGAMLLYIFANYFLKDFIKKNFLTKYENLETKFKKNEIGFFLLYRFVGGIPFQIANVLPVIFNVSIKNYLLGTFIGIIPSIFVMVTLGSGIEKIIIDNETAPSFLEMIYSPEIYIPIVCFFILILVTLIIKKFFYKN